MSHALYLKQELTSQTRSRMASHHPVLRGAEGEAFSAHLLLHAHSFGRIFEVEQKKTGPEPVIT